MHVYPMENSIFIYLFSRLIFNQCVSKGLNYGDINLDM